MSTEVKPSYKSVEGQSVGFSIVSVFTLIYNLLDQAEFPIEQVLTKATTVEDIVSAYQAFAGANNIAHGINAASVASLLIFLFFVYSKFVDSRTEIKAKAATPKPASTELVEQIKAELKDLKC